MRLLCGTGDDNALADAEGWNWEPTIAGPFRGSSSDSVNMSLL